ncbi:MAG: L-lactate dehydrogenase [Janthinobacterium lividum]
MPSIRSKVTIIGAGTVGVTCAYSLVLKGTAQEIVLINRDAKKAEGEANDLQHAVPLGQPVKVSAGDYKDAADSAIVIFTAGVPSTSKEESRLELLEKNAAVLRECLEKLKAENFSGVLLIASNPVDVLTYIAQEVSGLPHSQVIGSGTVIDTNRLRTLLGEELGIEARSVHGYIIGEHGDSSVAVWSGAQVAGMPLANFPGSKSLPSPDELLRRVRDAGPEVLELKGNTCYAIASCIERICEAILRNEQSVLTVSTRLNGEYKLQDVCLSTPCIVGQKGVVKVLELPLDPAELKALTQSGHVVRDAFTEEEAARSPKN